MIFPFFCSKLRSYVWPGQNLISLALNLIGRFSGGRISFKNYRLLVTNAMATYNKAHLLNRALIKEGVKRSKLLEVIGQRKSIVLKKIVMTLLLQC